MKKTHLILSIAAVLFIGVGTAQAVSVWNEPACGPTGCNTEIPLNVGALPQNKEGFLGLGLGTAVPERRLHVNGTIGISNRNFLDLGLGVKSRDIPEIGKLHYVTSASTTPNNRQALKIFGGRINTTDPNDPRGRRLIELFDDVNVFGTISVCNAVGSCSPITGGGDGLWTLNSAGTAMFQSVLTRRVGIGTNAPFADLHISDPTGGASVMIDGFTSGTSLLQFNSNRERAFSIYRPANTVDLAITSKPVGSADAVSRNIIYMKENGFVGIGTIPTAKFHVKLADDVNVKMYSGAGKAQWDVKNDGGQKIPLNIEANPIALTGGNVGVGTLSPNTFKLEIAGHTGPSEDNRFDLGSPTKRWANLYATNIYECVESGSCTEISGGAGGDSKWASSTNSRNNISNKNLTGSVGIGTTTPTSRLHVDGTTRVDGLLAVFGNMYSSGKVGLGTNAPATKLDIDNGTTNYTVGLIARTASTLTGTSQLPVAVISNNTNTVNTGVGLRFGAKNGNGSNNAPLAQISAVTEQVSTGAVNYGGLQFSTANGARFVDAMRISNAGNVGIGTLTPKTKLNVAGVVGIDGVGSSRVLGQLKFGVSDEDISTAGEGYGVGTISLNYTNATKPALDIFGAPKFDGYGPVGNRLVRVFDDLDVASDVYANHYNICTGTGNARVCNPMSTGGQWVTSGNNIANTNTGNVGIGTYAPTARLHVANANSVNALVESTSGNASISLKAGTQPTWIMSNLATDGNFRLAHTDPNGGTKLFVEKGSGDVGIGTTNPGSKLDVEGGVTANNIRVDRGGYISLGTAAIDSDVKLDVDGPVRLKGLAQDTTSTKVLVADNDGKIGYKETTSNGDGQKVCVAVGYGGAFYNFRVKMITWFNEKIASRTLIEINVPATSRKILGVQIEKGEWFSFKDQLIASKNMNDLPQLPRETQGQIFVPSTWTARDCQDWVATQRGAIDSYQLGCIFPTAQGNGKKFSYSPVGIVWNGDGTAGGVIGGTIVNDYFGIGNPIITTVAGTFVGANVSLSSATPAPPTYNCGW